MTNYSLQQVKTYIPINYEQIVAFCQKWQITEFALFGSVLTDDFRLDQSDVDVLISFDQKAHWTLLDWVDMEEEIKLIFQRDVDLVSRRGIERSQNMRRRQTILNSAQVIYARS
jgi:predicted nucleotidyltransferase